MKFGRIDFEEALKLASIILDQRGVEAGHAFLLGAAAVSADMLDQPADMTCDSLRQLMASVRKCRSDDHPANKATQ